MTPVFSTALVAVMTDPATAPLEVVKSDLPLDDTLKEVELAARCLGCDTEPDTGTDNALRICHRDLDADLAVVVHEEESDGGLFIRFESDARMQAVA